jgi:hypothetical protein
MNIQFPSSYPIQNLFETGWDIEKKGLPYFDMSWVKKDESGPYSLKRQCINA